MSNATARKSRRLRRKRGVRKRIFGTPQRPRLTVYRSLQHMYAQIVDDLQGRTLVSASTNEKDAKVERAGGRTGAAEIGRRIAERARQAGIEQVVFDRSGYRYHGRVKAVADAAREGGLKF